MGQGISPSVNCHSNGLRPSENRHRSAHLCKIQGFWEVPARTEGNNCPNSYTNLTLRAAQQLGLLHEQLVIVDLGFPRKTQILSSYTQSLAIRNRDFSAVGLIRLVSALAKGVVMLLGQ